MCRIRAQRRYTRLPTLFALIELHSNDTRQLQNNSTASTYLIPELIYSDDVIPSHYLDGLYFLIRSPLLDSLVNSNFQINFGCVAQLL